jgi:hypothetical protein
MPLFTLTMQIDERDISGLFGSPQNWAAEMLRKIADTIDKGGGDTAFGASLYDDEGRIEATYSYDPDDMTTLRPYWLRPY